MSEAPISVSEIWNTTTCFRCHEPIKKGEPRFVLMFAELGIGPGFRADLCDNDDNEEEEFVPFEPGVEEEGDDFYDDHGLCEGGAIAMCGPCSGEDPTITIPNPWFEKREEACKSARSVRTIAVSNLKLPHRDSYTGSPNDDCDGALPEASSDRKHDSVSRSGARNEAEDGFLSQHADHPIQPPLKQDDQRTRMQRFLLTPAASRLRKSTRQVLQLWADGKKQNEVAEETKISQSTVSRIINDGKSLIYSQRLETA